MKQVKEAKKKKHYNPKNIVFNTQKLMYRNKGKATTASQHSDNNDGRDGKIKWEEACNASSNGTIYRLN